MANIQHADMTYAHMHNAVITKRGTAAPTDAPMGAGDLYLDTSAGVLYYAIGTLVSDWVRLNAKNNPTAGGAPTTGDDTTQGYSRLSIWVDQSADPADIYLCTNPAEGAAVWILISGSGSGVLNNFSANADPTASDDSGDGYEEGSLWVNTTANTAWICVDATAGAANWNQIDAAGGSGAPTDASYITASPEAGLSNETTLRTYLDTQGVQYVNRIGGGDGIDFSAGSVIDFYGSAPGQVYKTSLYEASIFATSNSTLIYYLGAYLSMRNGTGDPGYSPSSPDTLLYPRDGVYWQETSTRPQRVTMPFSNLAAAAAPTVNDDSGDGYEVGSLWVDTTNDKTYLCTDASSGAAVWKETSNAGGQIATGTYTGDGGATKAITGLGFQPKHVHIYTKAGTAFGWKNTGDSTGSMNYTNSGLVLRYADDHIISRDSDGFTVGDGTATANVFNVNTTVYSYTAWS